MKALSYLQTIDAQLCLGSPTRTLLIHTPAQHQVGRLMLKTERCTVCFAVGAGNIIVRGEEKHHYVDSEPRGTGFLFLLDLLYRG
jgi:hypothetical protein